MKEMNEYLQAMSDKKASDLFITAGLPASIKLNGQVEPLFEEVLDPDAVEEFVKGVMTKQQLAEFEDTKECNFAISAHGIGRFRVSAFYQRSQAGMVLRRIETRIPTLGELKLPEIINQFSVLPRGLVLVVGPTGSGKSSTLASMVGHRNLTLPGHIISIEEPIEFIHHHEKSIVTQREVGIDTDSFHVALKNALRQAPDMVQIGEIRTRETMELALTFAETGHLCVATLHANNAYQALDRIAHFVSEDRREQLWMDISLNLQAIVAQQLIPRKDGNGRIVACEILMNTPVIADHIRKGKLHVLKELMVRSSHEGMQTFDQDLYRLYKEDLISYEHALNAADSANDLRIRIKLGKEVIRDNR